MKVETSTTAGQGAAGQQGDRVRSDCHAAVALRDAGGIELDLTSKVAAYYGASIQGEVTRVLGALGVEHASCAIDDRGALPFVLAARVETAARRAGVAGGDARPERTVELPSPSARDRARRSRLYLPGNEPKFFVNAGLHGPDAVILDLEDSVHPTEKDAARLIVRNALRCVDFGAAERMVRINQLPLGLDDVDAIVPEAPDLLLIPKVEHADQVREIDARARTAAGDRPMWLMPILESALGIEHAFDIASATESVAAVTIGLEDYTADLGVPKTSGGDESTWARRRLVNAAHAARVQAIDSVFGDVGDMDALRAWAEGSRALGFEGMGCIHPRQVRVVHAGFAPTQAEIDKALEIVNAFDDAQAKGLAVVSLRSKMIDPPVVLRAQRLVERARRDGLVTG